jgi:hypothetical protein
MSKKLEEFIQKNREQFDDRTPRASVWNRIEENLWDKPVPLWNNVVMWRAAAVLLLALSGYLYASRPHVEKSNPAVVAKEFSEVERFYTAQINEKIKLIHDLKGEGLNGFTHDFQQLEAMYNVLKEELKNSPSEKVKDALELNLLVRIGLLNQQLSKLDNTRKTKSEI